LKNNASVIDEYFGEFNVQRKLNKAFKIVSGLRFIRLNDNTGNIQGYENHLRFNLDLSFNHKVKQLSLQYRLRYQNKNDLGRSKNEGDFANQKIRLKTSVKYNIKNWKLDPKFSAELYNRFEKNNLDNGFNKFRLSAGSSFKLKKIGKISLFYRFEKEFDVQNPKEINIISFKYSYTLKAFN
jgi:hypothetical protein